MTLGLRARFLLIGALLVATTAVTSAWSGLAFRKVSEVVDTTLRDSEQTTAATGALANALEREDDALLLNLADRERGGRELAARRVTVEDAFKAIDVLLNTPDERRRAEAIRERIDAYHSAGDVLVASSAEPGARLRYHQLVNPQLQRAVGAVAAVRDEHFVSAQRVAEWARDQARRATEIVVTLFVVALSLSLLGSVHLARVVVGPIRMLTNAVEKLRGGDFDRRVAVLRHDEVGRLSEGFNRMADDLGEFRRANIGEMVRAKETLESTLEALPDAVFVVDAGGKVSTANARARVVAAAALAAESVGSRGGPQLGELPLPEATRTAVEQCLHGEDHDGAVVDLSRALTLVEEGRSRRLLPRVVPIRKLSGGRHGAVLILSDVTELARLDEMRVELVAVASHELQTPLTTLRMTLLLLEERASRFEPRDRELVATAIHGAAQLSGIVVEFLDLTRIEAGQLRLNLDRVDVRALVDSAVSAVRPSCDDEGVALESVVADDVPGTIAGDRTRLGIVLANLLTNALKYSPSGGTIGVEATRDTLGGAPAVRLTVTDAGPGVPIEHRERVFDKFFRVEHEQPVSDEGVRGSGIGLYIAREIMQAHGGSLVCEANPTGRGARFVVRALADDGEELTPPRDPASSADVTPAPGQTDRGLDRTPPNI